MEEGAQSNQQREAHAGASEGSDRFPFPIRVADIQPITLVAVGICCTIAIDTIGRTVHGSLGCTLRRAWSRCGGRGGGG